jgi:hypothetical protein
LLRVGPLLPTHLSLATVGDLRDNRDMTPHLTLLLLLLTGSVHALTFATVLSAGFPHLDTLFPIVRAVFSLSVLVRPAPLVLLPLRPFP